MSTYRVAAVDVVTGEPDGQSALRVVSIDRELKDSLAVRNAVVEHSSHSAAVRRAVVQPDKLVSREQNSASDVAATDFFLHNGLAIASVAQF